MQNRAATNHYFHSESLSVLISLSTTPHVSVTLIAYKAVQVHPEALWSAPADKAPWI